LSGKVKIEGQVFIRSKKTLCALHLPRYLTGMHNLIHSILWIKIQAVCSLRVRGKQRCGSEFFFERKRRILLKFFALPNPSRRLKCPRFFVSLGERGCFAIIHAAGWPIYFLLAVSVIAVALISEGS